MITKQDFDELAQNAHLCFGGLMVLLGGLFFGLPGALSLFCLVAIGSGLKEFLWDERYEDEDHRGSNLKDFSYYLFGAGGALILYAAHYYYAK